MKLWTNNFQWISESLFWLLNSLYALLIGLPFIMPYATDGILIFSTLSFIAGIWIPGCFTAYLMDRFSRKSILLLVLAVCLSITVFLPYLTQKQELFYLLRGIQGMCYGIAINLCNILMIDITTSSLRSKANGTLARIGRLGICTAVAGAGISYHFMGAQGIHFFSIGTGILAFLCLCMTSLTFRAPMELPVVSSDRFFLPGTWLEAVNTFFLAIPLGGLISVSLRLSTQFYDLPTLRWVLWVAFITGFLLAFLSQRHMESGKLKSKKQIGIGLAMITVGCFFFYEANNIYLSSFSLLLLGAGIEISSAEFLNLFIRMSDHCQRSTANSTYLFSWETGCGVGVCIGFASLIESDILLYISLITLILFFAFTEKHYKRSRRRR